MESYEFRMIKAGDFIFRRYRERLYELIIVLENASVDGSNFDTEYGFKYMILNSDKIYRIGEIRFAQESASERYSYAFDKETI